MNPSFAFVLKLVIAFTWGYGIACSMRPELPLAPLMVSMVKALTLIHILEIGLFWPRIRAAEGSRLGNIVGVFLFGIVHANSLPPAGD